MHPRFSIIGLVLLFVFLARNADAQPSPHPLRPPPPSGSHPHPPPHPQPGTRPPPERLRPPPPPPLPASSPPTAVEEPLPEPLSSPPTEETPPEMTEPVAEVAIAEVEPTPAVQIDATPTTPVPVVAIPIVIPPPESTAPAATPIEPAKTGIAWQIIALLAVTALTFLGWWFARRRGQIFASEAEHLARQQMRLNVAHQQLKLQSAQLREQSILDPLTGVLNRQAFAHELRELSEQAAIAGRTLSLILFDLDNFKTINDRHGHLAGDAALKLVVGIVREHLVSADVFGRFGGDEFLIAPIDQPLVFCRDLAERIRAAVEARAPAHQPPLPGLTLSMGIAQADADTGYVADELFARADAALYEAKRLGRNRVILCDTHLIQKPANALHRHL
jgi:diguanylate cyclase (GGDEF)-like protein